MHPPEMQDPLVDSGLLMNWFTDSISIYVLGQFSVGSSEKIMMQLQVNVHK